VARIPLTSGALFKLLWPSREVQVLASKLQQNVMARCLHARRKERRALIEELRDNEEKEAARLAAISQPGAIRFLRSAGKLHAQTVTTRSLGAAKMREQFKRNRYQNVTITCADPETTVFVPIVFETYGGVGEEAKKFFEKIYLLAEQRLTMTDFRELFKQMFDRIAAEIVRNNAIITARYRSV